MYEIKNLKDVAYCDIMDAESAIVIDNDGNTAKIEASKIPTFYDVYVYSDDPDNLIWDVDDNEVSTAEFMARIPYQSIRVFYKRVDSYGVLISMSLIGSADIMLPNPESGNPVEIKVIDPSDPTCTPRYYQTSTMVQKDKSNK